MIEIKNLTKRYGEHAAVSDLSITIESGQVYGFLGPNGAGKSTTMNIMTGCLAATSGQVLIDGFDIYKDSAEAKARIGYLPEQPPLYTDMTPLEYLRFVGEAKGLRRGELADQVAIAMDRTQIAPMKDRLIRNLSKGYRQRVGIAQALLGNPDVIILDEPMVGLDPAQILEMRSLIRELGQTHTVILSSHILSEISAVCDRIMIISAGRLMASGTPEELAEMMTASDTLQLEVRGSADAVRSALSCVEGIERLTLNGTDVPPGAEIGTLDAQEQDVPQEAAPACEEAEEPTPDALPAENGEDGICRVVIYCARGCDLREAVFFAFCDARLPILLMQHRSMSLEQVFLEITAEAEAPAEEPETYLFGNEFVKDTDESADESGWTEEMLRPMESIDVPELVDIPEQQEGDDIGSDL